MSRANTGRRLDALEGGGTGASREHCWLTAHDGESRDEAIARHKLEEGCVEDSGGHIVWCDHGSVADREHTA